MATPGGDDGAGRLVQVGPPGSGGGVQIL